MMFWTWAMRPSSLVLTSLFLSQVAAQSAQILSWRLFRRGRQRVLRRILRGCFLGGRGQLQLELIGFQLQSWHRRCFIWWWWVLQWWCWNRQRRILQLLILLQFGFGGLLWFHRVFRWSFGKIQHWNLRRVGRGPWWGFFRLWIIVRGRIQLRRWGWWS